MAAGKQSSKDTSRKNIQHDKSRHITERIEVSGTLLLQSPAHFGNGAVRGDVMVDMSLLLDEAEATPRALIPGTTIAGALRGYLRERLGGYPKPKQANHDSMSISGLDPTLVRYLFGPQRTSNDESAEQSLLIVEDALSSSYQTALRDGVRIDPETGVAFQDDRGGAKFDVELLEAGTQFGLKFELLLTQSRDAATVLPAFLAALGGLEQGEIRLGLRKRRGYGRCRVGEWTVRRYQMRNAADLCAWLESDASQPDDSAITGTLQNIFAKLYPTVQRETTDLRRQFSITATFGLEKSSLLIRSGFGNADMAADFVHLHARSEDNLEVPVIPGTSWAGVVRHRCLRIANTLAAEQGNEAMAQQLVDNLFGIGPNVNESAEARALGKPTTGVASRATFDETQVANGQSLHQTRVRIDRFTGGAFESALFEEAPIYGTSQTRIGFHLHVREPQDYEIGLLLLVLKDLWTGDLPIGGEASVGRGRLTGLNALVFLPGEEEATSQQMLLDRSLPGLGLKEAERIHLQQYVDALWVKAAKEE